MSLKLKNGLFLLTLAGLAATSSAQWTGMSIHPGGPYSSANGASDGIAVGGYGFTANSITNTHAGIWTNGGTVFTDLHPNVTSSYLSAGDSHMQVGTIADPAQGHAARWFGTAASFEDMNPSRYSNSYANAMYGNKIGGIGYREGEGNSRPLLWNGGDHDDYVDLTPTNGSYGGVWGMTETMQVGEVLLAGESYSKACYWTGTAESWVSLDPAGATGSIAYCANGGLQGGSAYFGAGYEKAILWSGSAASAVNLHPDGVDGSVLKGMSEHYQVGSVYIEGQFLHTHAGFWSGTKNSWVDLHDFLPDGFGSSEATGVVEYADHIEVYGLARREFLGDDPIAVMWTQPVPEPGTFVALGLGLVCLMKRKRKA